MKKLIVILVATIAVISCSKKVTSGATSGNTSSGNNEKIGVANTSNNIPAAEAKAASPAAVNTNTDAASTASKTTTKEPGQLSAEQQGQATYGAKCGKCHGLKVTTDYTVNRWITVMQVMAGPSYANLSDVEKENVLAYVKLNAKKG